MQTIYMPYVLEYSWDDEDAGEVLSDKDLLDKALDYIDNIRNPR